MDGRRVMVRFVALVARVPRYLRLGWLLVQEPAVSGRGKAVLAGALGYAVSPIDPVPGFIPVLGQLDDLAVLLLGVRAALRSAPPELAEQHLKTAGLSHEQLETDLLTIRATTVWIAARAGAAAARLGKTLLQRVLRPNPLARTR
jgi:uncharacterized membrane protein YkvA (DUF1232 family)